MMRPFVVMPAELMPFMDMHTSHENMPDPMSGGSVDTPQFPPSSPGPA
jgi:hypothetical protein